jgi:hypothetical protein
LVRFTIIIALFNLFTEESVCDLAVFFEPFVADISDSQRIYFKDRQNLGFEKASVKSYLDVCSLSG